MWLSASHPRFSTFHWKREGIHDNEGAIWSHFALHKTHDLGQAHALRKAELVGLSICDYSHTMAAGAVFRGDSALEKHPRNNMDPGLGENSTGSNMMR